MHIGGTSDQARSAEAKGSGAKKERYQLVSFKEYWHTRMFQLDEEEGEESVDMKYIIAHR